MNVPREELPWLLAQVMRERLTDPKNIVKGDTWSQTPMDVLFLRAQGEMEELDEARCRFPAAGTWERLREEIGDVAAYLAMMLARLKTMEAAE